MRAIRKAFKSDGVIIYRAFVHPQVSWFVKRLILLVAAYIISPIDIIP
ncbi:DUF1232 domain-containing protein [Patescibacteria group bacterium]|nr:DUF1232 domain-containing protein [Patescibacteria group bacterium]